MLILDNCEHVSAEAARVALDILRAAAEVRVLTTSREPLGVAGEAFVALGPLPEPDAVELFARRYRAAHGDAPAEDEAETVRRIVRRLDGLPLALELAAAKARTLTLAEIDAGLDDRFALLSAGPRTAEPRHRTLRALVDWSWETLDDEQRTALLTSAVYPDGIGAGDAATVARLAGIPFDAFDALVDRSLLHRADGRYRMLETVREYGVDRLRADGAEQTFRALQARTIAELAEAHDARLRGPGVREAIAWFDANEENLSAALRACEQDDAAGMGVRLVRAVTWAWMMRERFEELQSAIPRFAPAMSALDSEAAVVVGGIARMFAEFAALDDRGGEDAADLERFATDVQLLTDAAARHPSPLTAAIPPLLRAAYGALLKAGPAAPWSRDFELSDEGLSDAPLWTQAFVAMLRSAVAQNGGDVDTLGRESEKALALFGDLGDVWGIAFSSQMRSEWLMLEGRLEEALEIADTAAANLAGLTSWSDVLQQRAQSVGLLVRLGRFDEARERVRVIEGFTVRDGSARVIAQARMAAATLAIAEGDGAGALAALDDVDGTATETFPDQIIGWWMSRRAQALLLLGRVAEAADAVRGALDHARRSGDQPIIADAALSLACWFAAEGDDAHAHRALAVSAALRGRPDEADPVLKRLRATLEPAPEETSDAGSDLDALTALLG